MTLGIVFGLGVAVEFSGRTIASGSSPIIMVNLVEKGELRGGVL